MLCSDTKFKPTRDGGPVYAGLGGNSESAHAFELRTVATPRRPLWVAAGATHIWPVKRLRFESDRLAPDARR
jgi:hypothetical protein